jgi:hypothetical protein
MHLLKYTLRPYAHSADPSLGSIISESSLLMHLCEISVLQVLQQLPEGLAIAVLAAPPADLEHQLDLLPASLHHLAIEAAFPSIRGYHSLTLDFNSDVRLKPEIACAVLHAATTASSALRNLHLSHVPLTGNDRLLQLI